MYVSTINPFYATRFQRSVSKPNRGGQEPIYARLPRAPINGSPVPHRSSFIPGLHDVCMVFEKSQHQKGARP